MTKKIDLKKAIIGLLIGILILPFLAKTTKAFETPSLDYQFQFAEAISMEEMNLQSFVNETMKAVAASIQYLGMGKFWDKTEMKKNPGLLTSASSIIIGSYLNPPASGAQYFADMGHRLKFIEKTYAEDQKIYPGSVKEGKTLMGFEMMRVTQPIWKAFRNISYLLLVLVLVGMGFAVMFRLKISPQAVITIQSALPKIVIALILITFSYAIVGFMIDIAIFLTSLISLTFVQIFIDSTGGVGKSILEGAISFFSLSEKNTGGVLFLLFAGTATLPLAGIAMILAAPIFLMFFVFFLSPVGILLNLILTILILIAVVRTLWVLLRTFAMIVISLIFGPFIILAGTLPGTNAIGSWFKNLASQVAVLPVMAAMFFLGHYLMLAGVLGIIQIFFSNTGEFFSHIIKFELTEAFNVIVEGIAFGPFWALNALLFPIIGIFILLLIPKAADIIQSAITKKPFQYGTAIGEAFGPVKMAGMAGYKYGMGTAAQYLERVSTPPTKEGEPPGKPSGWKATTAELIRTTTGMKKG